MLKTKCDTGQTITIPEMTPFQGELKKRTSSVISELKESLETDGLIMPFVVWKTDDKKFILDGHGRYEAIIMAAVTDPKLLEQEFPVIYIEADTEDDARKALLQIVSVYGRLNKKGVASFAATISSYKAPVINKTFRSVAKAKKVVKAEKTHVTFKVTVPAEQAHQLREILSSVQGVVVK